MLSMHLLTGARSQTRIILWSQEDLSPPTKLLKVLFLSIFFVKCRSQLKAAKDQMSVFAFLLLFCILRIVSQGSSCGRKNISCEYAICTNVEWKVSNENAKHLWTAITHLLSENKLIYVCLGLVPGHKEEDTETDGIKVCLLMLKLTTVSGSNSLVLF